MTILIAQPVRKSTPEFFRRRSLDLVASLTYTDVDYGVYENDLPPVAGSKYMTNAQARNGLLDEYLRPEHSHVLWLDVDIIDLPVDLVERLLAISKAHHGAIVAPAVWMEKVAEGPVSVATGGWFYDTGGFVDATGRPADFHEGIPGTAPLVEMASVGCVYLVPAHWYEPTDWYKKGLRYRPRGDEVEHISFCRQARAQGARILAAREICVIHAYLPKYGERWH